MSARATTTGSSSIRTLVFVLAGPRYGWRPGSTLRPGTRDLRVLDPTGRAGVLALNANRVPALRPCRRGSAHRRDHQLVDHIGTQVVAHHVGAHTASPSSRCISCGDASPACSANCQRERLSTSAKSPQQKRLRLTGWLRPSEPASDACERRVELLRPSLRVYAGGSGHRVIVVSVHNRRSSRGGSPSAPSNTRRRSNR